MARERTRSRAFRNAADPDAKEKPPVEDYLIRGAREVGQSDLTDEDRRDRLRRMIELLEIHADEEDAARMQRAGASVSADGKDGKRERNRIGKFYHRWGLHLREVADGDVQYLKINGLRSDGGVTDRQLKALILVAALEKNWTTLHIYKDRTHIDEALTVRAREMILALSQRGMPLEGMRLHVSAKRLTELEPWNDGVLSGKWNQTMKHVSERKDAMVTAFQQVKDGAFGRMGMKMMFQEAKPDETDPPSGQP